MYNKKDPQSIQKMFGSIAKDYDFANACLSFRMHRSWNRALIKEILGEGEVKKVLDLCSGTGDIGLGILNDSLTKKKSVPEVAFLDFCSEMLAVCEEKVHNMQTSSLLQFIQADATAIPLPDASFDAVTLAYGIRNIKEPKKCMEEVFRVLTKGGRFGILELTKPKNAMLQWGHRLYLEAILPSVGKWVTSNKDAYSYLCNSIKSFVSPDELERNLKQVGFRRTYQRSLLGGVATVIISEK